MRTSSRLPTRFEANALTLALDELKARRMAILDLTISNPIAAGLHFPSEALQEALGGLGVSSYCPDAMGSHATRKAVAAWHGHDVRADDVLLTASTSEAYSWLFKLLCDPGDAVLVPSPSYPLFEWLARLEGISTRSIPAYFHERWHQDLDAMEQAVHGNTRAIVAVNPNNPTGNFLSRSEWGALTDLCARKGLALIVDEVFADYGLEAAEDRMPTALQDQDPPCPVFVLSGLSKVAALPQVKLGWIIARGTQARDLLGPLSFIADQYLSVSTSAQIAAPEILRGAPELQARIHTRLRANLANLDVALNAHPHLSRLPVEGGWTVLLRRPAVDSDEVCVLRILREAGVLMHPGHFFDLPGDGHLVLSLLTAETAFTQGLRKALPLIG